MSSEDNSLLTSSENESATESIIKSDSEDLAYPEISSGQEDEEHDDAALRKKKRKRVGMSSQIFPKAKRLKGHYVDEYRLLYNSTVEDARERFKGEQSASSLSTSQIGMSVWTAKEKTLLFNAVARLGRDAIPEIASAIGSKSEVQVREYILLLRDGLVEHVLNDRQQVLMSLANIPAAVELSEECCQSLERAGQALAWYQDNHDARVEQKKHGENWLLTSRIAKKVDESLFEPETEEPNPTSESAMPPSGVNEDAVPIISDIEVNRDSKEDGHPSIVDEIPAAKLLNLSNFLLLSETIFMNSGRNNFEDNWRSIAEEGEEPSIYFTAFEDIHRLVVSVTKRLILASLHQASSRLRAEDWRTSHAPQPNVRRWDVDTAVDILNMKKNGNEFWARTARRCGVHVLERNIDKDVLTYDQVELELGYPQHERASKHREDPNAAVPFHVAEDSDQNLLMDDGALDGSNDDPSDLSSDSMQGFRLNRRESLRKQFELEEDDYAERRDQLDSRREEAKLWDMLEQKPRHHDDMEADFEPVVSGRAPTRRKHIDQLKDWRDWTHYHPFWMERQNGREIEGATIDARAVDVVEMNNSRGSFLTPLAKSRQTLPVRQQQREISQTEGTMSSTNESSHEETSQDEDGGDEETQSPRMLAPRTARAIAASQLQGVEYLQELGLSDDEFDPNA